MVVAALQGAWVIARTPILPPPGGAPDGRYSRRRSEVEQSPPPKKIRSVAILGDSAGIGVGVETHELVRSVFLVMRSISLCATSAEHLCAASGVAVTHFPHIGVGGQCGTSTRR